MEVERGAHRKHQRSGQAAAVGSNPYLLFRRAQADPHHLCLAVVHEANIFCKLALRERAERRRTSTGDRKTRKLFLQACGERCSYPGSSAIEKVPVSTSGRASAQFQHYIRTVDALCVSGAQPAA